VSNYIWISNGHEDEACARYRAFNTARHLIHYGQRAETWIGFDPARWWVHNPPATPWTNMSSESTVIVQRVPYTANTEAGFRRVAETAGDYGYDIDDLLLTEEYTRAIEWARFVTVSTPQLRAAILKRWPGKRVYVVRNRVSIKSALLSGTRAIVRNNHTVNIGYASGSRTHNEDFAMIQSQLDDVLEAHPYANLHLFGSVDPNGNFEGKWASRSRLFRWPHIHPDVLPLVLNTLFDINLVPLVQNEFNECKSTCKFMEAGLFGVPSIVSHVGAFKDLPTEVVYKAEPGDWSYLIGRLVERSQERHNIGRAAREYILRERSHHTAPDLGGLL
jgi:hypothetical protein